MLTCPDDFAIFFMQTINVQVALSSGNHVSEPEACHLVDERATGCDEQGLDKATAELMRTQGTSQEGGKARFGIVRSRAQLSRNG